MSEPVHRRRGSLIATVKAVLWGFLGIRRNADYQKDIERLNPLQIMAVGVVMAFLFVGALILLVNWVAG
jgi:EamA domain-containing membrane protein RarD